MNSLLPVAGLWLGVLVLTASCLDIRYRRLPNWLCALALGSGLAFGLALGGWADVQSALVHALVALAVGIGFYALGWIGAGDAKYYASLAAWFPLRLGVPLLIAVSLAGLLLLIVWTLARRKGHRRGAERSQSSLFDKLPYGVAISLGAATTFVLAGSDLIT